MIEKMVGGTGFHVMDFGKQETVNEGTYRNFSDFAVLFRTAAPIKPFFEVLQKAGIPCQMITRENFLEDKDVSLIISLLKVTEGMGSFNDMEATFDHLVGGRHRKLLEAFKFWSYRKKLNLGEALDGAKKFPIPGIKRSKQCLIVQYLEKINILAQNLRGLDIGDKLARLEEESRGVTAATDALQNDSSWPLQKLHAAAKAHKGAPGPFLSEMALKTDTDLLRVTDPEGDIDDHARRQGIGISGGFHYRIRKGQYTLQGAECGTVECRRGTETALCGHDPCERGPVPYPQYKATDLRTVV